MPRHHQLELFPFGRNLPLALTQGLYSMVTPDAYLPIFMVSPNICLKPLVLETKFSTSAQPGD